MIERLGQSHAARMLEVPSYSRRVVRLSRTLGRLIGRPLSLNWLGRRVSASNGATSSDVLICSEAQLKRGRHMHLVSGFPGKRILLVRDLVDASFVEQMRPLFSHIYSYDPVQCERLGMEYLEQFFPFNVEDARPKPDSVDSASDTLRCFFLGRDKGRAQRLEALAAELVMLGCNVDFCIVKDDTSQVVGTYHVDEVLSYEANLTRAMGSDVLVEINQPGQTGLTLRPLEAAFFDKKLITDNKRVRDTDFYHPDRFYVLGDETRGLQQFLASKAPSVAPETLRKHSPAGLMDRLLEISV
ncbi:hypothetical protein [Pseudomonas sp. Teo4]|uniref:hypothetical protein n=1 Tax=Pseudomonas sp. Teo4 TaxID=3064528 RepID=UPI002ACB113F|nr:hypothetical protein [Pseudomonas sp. Teo4]